MKQNLTYKNIRDFLPGESICLHIPQSGGMGALTTECEFIAFEKGKVTGKVLSVNTNPELYKRKIDEGWIETVALNKCSLYGKIPGESHPHYHWFDPIGHAAYESAEERHLSVPEEHPSYGMLSISRRYGGGATPCFGSPILHQHKISLKISKASLQRSLHEDSFYPKTQLIEVEMTPQQFADMLTSPNTSGTPVTIKYVGHEPMEECPFVSKLDQFESELKSKVKTTFAETKRKMANISEIINSGKPLGKKDREHVEKLLASINMEVESNFPFLQSQMIEEMGKVVGEAKAAIGAFLQERVKSLNLPSDTSAPILLENNS